MSVKTAMADSLGLLITADQDAWKDRNSCETIHELLGGPLVCLHANGNIKNFSPKFTNGMSRTHVFSSKETPDEVIKYTRLVIFVGASLTPEFLYYATHGCLVFVFEPCRATMEAFLEKIETRILVQKNICFFSGDVWRMPEPLRYLIPPDAVNLGPPAFYVIPEAYSKWYVGHIRDTVECVYYHHALYPYEERQRPDEEQRPVAGGFSFAQQKHLLENLKLLQEASCECATSPVEALRGACQGKTALLVAAGSSLDEQLPTIKALREQCVIICANKTYRTLLENGIVPDFVVLLDSSTASAQDIAHLPRHPETTLVAHILSGATQGHFENTYFLGHELEQLDLRATA